MSVPSTADILKTINKDKYGSNNTGILGVKPYSSSKGSSVVPSTESILSTINSNYKNYGLSSPTTIKTPEVKTPEIKMKEEEKKNIFQKIASFGENTDKTIRKFLGKTAVEGASLFAKTFDVATDVLSDFIEGQLRDPMRAKVLGDEKAMFNREEATKRADKWVEFYDKNIGSKTEAAKKFTEKMTQAKWLQPSEEWSKLSTVDKLTKKPLETVLEIGPGVVASLGVFAISVPVGFAVSAGSVADDIRTLAVDKGLDNTKADSLALGTGLLVGAIDKMVPDELFSPKQKGEFMSGLVKRIALTGLKEAGTEVAQEDIQIAVEGTLRDDLGVDEIVERNVMSALGGLLGGAGANMLVSFSNNIRNGSIADINTEDINKVKVSEDEISKTSPKKETTTVFRGTSEEAVQGEYGFQTFSSDKAIAEQYADMAGKRGETPKIIQEKIDNLNLKEVKQGDYLAALEDKNLKNEYDGVVFTDETGAKTYSIFNEALNRIRGEVKTDITQNKVEETPARTTEGVTPKELEAVTEEKIKNAKNVNDVRRTLKSIRVELENASNEAEALAVLYDEKTAGINMERVNTLKRTYANSKTFQQGDIETMRAYSEKSRELVNSVIENVQEYRPGLDEQEAFDYAMELPTLQEGKDRAKAIRELSAKEKTMKKYLDQLKAKQEELNLKESSFLKKEWENVLAIQEKLSRVVKVPTTKVPVGEGKKKVSRLEARIRGTLGNMSVEEQEKLGVSTYTQMNKKGQISLAEEYVKNNPEDAFKVLTGEINPPEGIIENAIYIALKNAGAENTDLALKLASLFSTRAGQNISILSELQPDNPVTLMEDIVKTRIEAYEKRTKQKSGDKIKKETKRVESEIKSPGKEDWNKFLESIRC